jgi:predicted Zn finger-like uncharacterized protein
MIVICEECGKKYQIDPSKIKGKAARFKCKACNHVIEVLKPEEKTPKPVSPPPPVEEPSADVAEEKPSAPEPEKKEEPPKKKERKKKAKKEKVKKEKTPKEGGPKSKGLGLRGKMIILFLLIPIIVIAAAGALYLRQLDSLTSLIANESSRVVTRMAEDAIRSTSRAVARECNLYIVSHPELRKTEYDQDPEFRKVAVQKVGKKGYTALYELPDSSGVWRTWAHANPKIIGIDMSKLKKPLKNNFPGFWKVYIGVKGGKESKGYYTWQDKDGSVRDKFMVCTPVEGTRYIIAATTYLDEFTMPIKDMEARAKERAVETRNTILLILAGTIILIGVIVSLYGHSLTGKIKSLTDTADRISVGELDAEIEIKSKDEIGDLAEAISRMQESIRLSIERLRRRR